MDTLSINFLVFYIKNNFSPKSIPKVMKSSLLALFSKNLILINKKSRFNVIK